MYIMDIIYIDVNLLGLNLEYTYIEVIKVFLCWSIASYCRFIKLIFKNISTKQRENIKDVNSNNENWKKPKKHSFLFKINCNGCNTLLIDNLKFLKYANGDRTLTISFNS